MRGHGQLALIYRSRSRKGHRQRDSGMTAVTVVGVRCWSRDGALLGQRGQPCASIVPTLYKKIPILPGTGCTITRNGQDIDERQEIYTHP